MYKMSIEVSVPSIEKKYDFLIPSVMKVNIAKKLISKAIIEYEGDVMCDYNSLTLCLKENGKMLKPNDTMEKTGIRDGSQIILV